MYRDDPLDDELELRAIVGDDPVDRLVAAASVAGRPPLEVALDVLRVLQGWVDEGAAGRWFTTTQRRLDGRDPIAALVAGDLEEVEDAARAWAAANG
jgi:prophage tail gpP-like protein